MKKPQAFLLVAFYVAKTELYVAQIELYVAKMAFSWDFAT